MKKLYEPKEYYYLKSNLPLPLSQRVAEASPAFDRVEDLLDFDPEYEYIHIYTKYDGFYHYLRTEKNLSRM